MAVPIAIRGLTKIFGSGAQATVAVDGIDLEIQPGELFFLLGPSGCGKTTLLRMIAGFEEPTRGRIRFGSRDVTRLAASRRNTGMVFQSYALWPHMTVEANVGFGLAVRRIGRDERRRRVNAALETVHMGAYAKRKPNQLSGGQQQRVALARAIVIRPDVLLLDEPLSNLDAKLRSDLRLEIRRICKESGITAVYVTHDQKEALSMADRIGVLDRGKLVQCDSPSVLYRKPESRFVAAFLGEANFFAGRVLSIGSDCVDVSTTVGRLRGVSSASLKASLKEGDSVTVSIRPEAIRMDAIASEGPNCIVGTVQSSTYSGETSHHQVIHASNEIVSVAELNPREEGRSGRRVFLSVDSEDVVLIPSMP